MSPETLAPYVLRTLVQFQIQGRVCTLQDLVDEIRARRGDIRRTVSALHREGYVDALRMRTTLAGLALGRAILRTTLPALRQQPASCVEAA